MEKKKQKRYYKIQSIKTEGVQANRCKWSIYIQKKKRGEAQRRNRTYLVTKVYYNVWYKKGMEKKKNVPLLKLIQYSWSIKTVIPQFQCDPFPKSLDLPGYDTSYPIAHTDQKEGTLETKHNFQSTHFVHGWCIIAVVLSRHLLVFPLRHCLLLAPDRLLRENHKRAQENHLSNILSLPQVLPFLPIYPLISISAVKGFYFETQYAALLQIVCSLLFHA